MSICEWCVFADCKKCQYLGQRNTVTTIFTDYTEYNPPSYIWTNNTGELVRCEHCIYHDHTYCKRNINSNEIVEVNDTDYCSWAVIRRKEE